MFTSRKELDRDSDMDRDYSSVDHERDIERQSHYDENEVEEIEHIQGMLTKTANRHKLKRPNTARGASLQRHSTCECYTSRKDICDF